MLGLLSAMWLVAGCAARPLALAPTSPVPPSPSATATVVTATALPPTSSPTPTRTATPTLTPTSTPRPGAHLVAFETYRDGDGEIYLLDTASNEVINLTGHPADDRAPAWRPDGRALAFESHRDGNWEIYSLDLSDGSLARLTDNPDYDGAPAWSPDGRQIAFESYRGGRLGIYVMAANGGEARRLGEASGASPSDQPEGAGSGGDYGPAWSPDGQFIAFTSWRDGNKEVYLVPADGGPARNLTQDAADDECPAWAPDGSELAFVSWRDVDGATGNRNAEIYRLSLADGSLRRLTDNLWPDLDPAWDVDGRLVWSAYDPGPPFETYDPVRPGDYHLYRAGGSGPVRLTTGAGDDRRPAPAPSQVVELHGRGVPRLDEGRGMPRPYTPGALAQVVEVPTILASYGLIPILVNEVVAPSLVAWQEELKQASGWDFLHVTLGSWRPLEDERRLALYAHDYRFLSWHKTGRALDLALEYKVDGVDQMVVAREDLGKSVYWRIYLRTNRQDGTQGEPLKDNPWLFWWRIVAQEEPQAYQAGGKRLPIPSGYYVDVTAIARRHGWERIASYDIQGDYSWRSDSNGMEYWHYQRTDGLTWWEAMRQIYDADTLEEVVGWQAGLRHAQTVEMMRSKGIPQP